MPSENLCAVILTALPVEFKAVRSFLTDCQRVRHPKGNIYERGKFEANHRTWVIGIAEIGAGDSNAAQQTERAITFFNPQVILFVGVAGGIKDVEIGDVVVSTKIYGYESGKAKETFEPRPTLGLSGFALLEEAKAEARSLEQAWRSRLNSMPEQLPKVVVGPIAAGEKVIASTKSSIYQFLRSNYGDALAVEMEGYGFLQAAFAEQSPTSAIVVRGISDLIDNKNDEIKNSAKQESEAVRQEKAALHASAFAFQILANFNSNPRFIDSQQPRNVSSQTWNDLFDSFQVNDLSIIAPLCQQVFEEHLTQAERDPYSELFQLNTLRDLRTVFERRDDLSLAVQWVGRVIYAFNHPPNGEAVRRVSPALQSWYDQHKPSAPISEPVKKSPGYLLIAFDPVDDRDKVAFTAELHSPDGTIKTDLLEPGIACSINEPHGPLSQAIRKAGNVKTIEIFLSWQHFKNRTHEWEIDTGFGPPKKLKAFRNTLVRSLDRLTKSEWVEEWLETLGSRWDYLQNCCQQELAQLCHRVNELECEVLESDLSSAEYLILELLSALPENLRDLERLLSIVVWSGIPIWLWFYSYPADSEKLPEKIDELLNANNLQDSSTFAAAVNKQLKTFPDLGVLCDCPTRLPVLVDWKNAPLRPPATESPLSA